MALGGKDENIEIISDVEVLNIQSDDTGCNPTDLPIAVFQHASVYSTALHSLITCGGGAYNGRLFSCTVQTLNVNQISMPPMNSTRNGFAIFSIQNEAISIGGLMEYDTISNTMETIRLNDTEGNWNQQTMPFSVYGHCAVTLDDNIIVIGGLDKNWKVSSRFSFIYVSMSLTIDTKLYFI